MRRIIVLRHGRTAYNHEGRIQGQLDEPLDSVGLAQAAALRGVLAADRVISSDLSRASVTATALGLPYTVDARLRETHFGLWQGLTGPEVAAQWPVEYEEWQTGQCLPVGGETPFQVGFRAYPCVVDALPADGTLLVVCHGGTARAILGRFLDLPPASWTLLSALGNTCWSTLAFGRRGWSLERHNTGLGPLLGAPTGSVPTPDR